MNPLKIAILFFCFFAFYSARGQNVFYMCLGNGDIVKTDVENCSTRKIVSSSNVFNDIALTSSGIMYGISAGNSPKPNCLYKIDTSNGNCTLIGPTANNLNSLVCDKQNNLFAAGDDLYEIDASSGNYKSLGKLTYGSAGDLTFFNDTMYLAAANNQLVRVSYTEGKANSASYTLIGTMSVPFGTVYGVVTVFKNGTIPCNTN